MKNEHGLTAAQEVFAVGVAAGLSQSDAYRKAYPHSVAWKDDALWVKASQLAAGHKVRLRIQALMAEAAADSGVTVAWVVERYRAIVEADPRDLVELRRTSCRHCWGNDHLYQRTPHEMRTARAQHRARVDEAKRRKLADPAPFDEEGGDGFRGTREPNPDCPECFGEGIGQPFFKDVRKLSPAGRRLLAGIKVTDKGMEIKQHDQLAALNALARYAVQARFDLPAITSTETCVDAQAAVLGAVARGELPPAQGQVLSALIDAQRKAFETGELAKRLEALERQIGAAGGASA